MGALRTGDDQLRDRKRGRRVDAGTGEAPRDLVGASSEKTSQSEQDSRKMAGGVVGNKRTTPS